MISPTHKLVGREDLEFREVDGEFFIYDEERDQVSLLNPTAAVAFGLCDGTRTRSEIIAEVARVFDQQLGYVSEQVGLTLDRLVGTGLVR